ncbi:MAG: hypothetical protein IPN34_08230 [Planctomycetes bacterium]|nr:hypothetical protein [Planctomycetota bacterium]
MSSPLVRSSLSRLALLCSLLGAAGAPRAEAQEFRSYPHAERPRGPLHNALGPARDALAADLERLRARPAELAERVERALQDLRGIGSGDPDAETRAFQAELLRLRGSVRLALGGKGLDQALEASGRADLERALSLWRSIAKETPWRFEAELGLGRCEEALGRRVEALRHWSSASEIDPLHEAPWLEKARLYREAGEEEQALAEIRAALQRLPGEIHLELELLACQIQAGGDHCERFGAFLNAIRVSPEPALRSRLALQMVQQALLLLRRDDAEKKDAPRALALLIGATELDPQLGDGWYFRADALARTGFVAFVDAVQAYERAIECGTRLLDEARLEQAKLVAVVYGKLLDRDRAQALRLMRRAQEFRAELAQREIGLGGIDARLVACFEEDIARGKQAVEAERWQEGLQAFDLAAISDPANAWVASYRGMCLGELGREDEMRAAFRDAMDIAVAKRQDVWLPFAELAEEARAAGRLEEARAFAARYLEAFPNGSRAPWFRERYS